MLLYLGVIFLAAVNLPASEAGKVAQINGLIVGVGMDNRLYMRRSTSNGFRWMTVPYGCCVTQIHLRSNGDIIGVGTNNNLYVKKSLFGVWRHVRRSCCVKDVTTFSKKACDSKTIVGVGMNGKLYSRSSLYKPWVGPYASSGTVTAVAGVTGAIYGIGMNHFVYRRKGLRGFWQKIPGSCCVKDIHVRDDIFQHLAMGIGMGNRLYRANFAGTKRVRWNFQGRHTCCVKSVQIQSRTVPVKIVGIGRNKELFFKPNINTPWSHVPRSGAVTAISAMNNRHLLGVATNQHLYVRSTVDSTHWRLVPRSCCVKSAVQLSNGFIIGVGMRNQLWVKTRLAGPWSHIRGSGSVTRITRTRSNKIIGIGMDNKLYVRNRYNHAWRGPLRNSGRVIDISMGSDGYLYGIGTRNSIYRKISTSLSSPWRLLPHHNCCVIGLTVN